MRSPLSLQSRTPRVWTYPFPTFTCYKYPQLYQPSHQDTVRLLLAIRRQLKLPISTPYLPISTPYLCNNGHNCHPHRRNPSLCLRQSWARHQSPKDFISRLVDPAFRLVLRTGLHRHKQGRSAAEIRKWSSGRYRVKSAVCSGLLHGGEGEAAADDDYGVKILSWRHVSLCDRFQTRHRLQDPISGVNLRRRSSIDVE